MGTSPPASHLSSVKDFDQNKVVLQGKGPLKEIQAVEEVIFGGKAFGRKGQWSFKAKAEREVLPSPPFEGTEVRRARKQQQFSIPSFHSPTGPFSGGPFSPFGAA